MELQVLGWIFVLLTIGFGFLLDWMVLEQQMGNWYQFIRKFMLGTINYGILTMLPFMMVFFLFNADETIDFGEIIAVGVILLFPLILIYVIRNFNPYVEFLQHSILDAQNWWKDLVLMILFLGVVYSMYYYGLIISFIM
ncbi:MAG: hypothetical protein D6732_15970 [Methanobacteriota archaeon]|nr:MAG: hypothetical protein D6732_15970 [Euryarchaeota archaeon]